MAKVFFKECIICKEIRKHCNNTGICIRCAKKNYYEKYTKLGKKFRESFIENEGILPNSLEYIYRCAGCKIVKPNSDFYISLNKNERNRLNTCKDCLTKRERERTKKKRRGLKKYNLNNELYDIMLLNQNNLCQICKDPLVPGKTTVVDHNHKTNQTRDILCHHCNSLLGFCKENEEVLLSAIKYLQKWQN